MRDFIFIANVVTALMQAMDTRLPGEPVFNICTGSATSVLELAHTVAGLCGRDVAIRFRAARHGEVAHSYGDPTAARQGLGLSSSTELRIGLAATLAWLEGVGEASRP